jgi:hypothetical protein
MDARTKINAHGFPFAHHDSDPDGVARACANKLLVVSPGRQHATESLALLRQVTCLRPA